MSDATPSLSRTVEGYRQFFGLLRSGAARFRQSNEQSGGLSLDILLTVLFSLFWLFFAWQHGFNNSPDSWYRGLLGKSIREGHPYFVNIMQGWFYNYTPWHHDACHSPLLPALYALFFLFFGYRISVANIIVSLSAGLLLFPLLRLGRRLFGTPAAGLVTYFLVAFNDRNDFLFEVFAGLSIPTTVMLLAFVYYFLWRLLESDRRAALIGGAVSLACFFYIRPGEQVIFAWLLFWSLLTGWKLLDRAAFGRLKALWLWASLLALPWLVRNLILFRHPFFTHTTAALWTDRGYDYWTYHESLPYPTLASYFANHSLGDFLHKLFIAGPGNFFYILGLTLNGPLWLYLLAGLAALAVIWRAAKSARERFFFLVVALTAAGYFAVYSLVPVLDKRYMMLPYFLFALTVVSALFYLGGRLTGAKQAAFYLALVLLVIGLQPDFWREGFRRQWTFTFRNSDQQLRADPLVQALKARVGKDEVILGPLGDVQRLNFATGLTFVEEPDNLRRLADPAAFFRRYRIRYSLVDVSRLLPPAMIERTLAAGDRIIFVIDPERGPAGGAPLFEPVDLLVDAAIKRAIRRGLRRRLVYLDSYHADEPAGLSLLSGLGIKPYIAYSDLVAGRERLFQCGLLLMRYGLGKKELSEAELAVIRQFTANGGRFLLLCPAWVWVAYEKKGLERLPYNRIAEEFGLLFSGDYAAQPFRIVDPRFRVKGLEPELTATYSAIVCQRGEPIMVGRNGRVAAARAARGDARIIAWAQNDLLSSEFTFQPAGRELIRRLFDWLYQ